MDSSSHNKPTDHTHNYKPQDLLSSAKVLAEAAKSSDNVDKGKAAGAAGDLLGAASQYGKLEEKSFGKYVEKAEDYLHQYGSSHSTTTHSTTTDTTPTHHSSSTPSEADAHSESGYGDYFKMAQGFLKKN